MGLNAKEQTARGTMGMRADAINWRTGDRIPLRSVRLVGHRIRNYRSPIPVRIAMVMIPISFVPWIRPIHDMQWRLCLKT